MTERRKNFQLTPQEKAEAREAIEILQGSGVSLVEAARVAVGRSSAIARLTFEESARRFFKSRLSSRLRSATVAWYEQQLDPMIDHWSGRPLTSITRKEILKYLEVCPSAPHRYRAMRALFRFAREQEPPWLAVDPTEGLKPPRKGGQSEVGILAVEEVEALMNKDSAWRPALALMLFAGIRPHEICGKGKPWLKWGSIDIDSRIIRIPAANAKTGKARVLEDLPENIWSFLDPGKRDENISPGAALSCSGYAQRVMGYKGPKDARLKPWPQDAMRHSFATYHLAKYSDPGKTSLLMGHEGSTALIYRHYRGLATKAEAERFFGIGG